MLFPLIIYNTPWWRRYISSSQHSRKTFSQENKLTLRTDILERSAGEATIFFFFNGSVENVVRNPGLDVFLFRFLHLLLKKQRQDKYLKVIGET